MHGSARSGLACWGALGLLTPLAGCSAPTDGARPAEPLRVVFLADTHIIGPQYECCSESDGVDNDSIMRTAERLALTRERVHAIDPPPDLVFLLGDVVHDAHVSPDLDWYEEEETAWSIASDLVAGFETPVHILWGNHDYEVSCGDAESFDRSFSHSLFERYFQAPPYTAVDAGGWRFVLLNSQLGPTWDSTDERCETSLGSFGQEQLAWLDEQLAEGLPTLVLTHHHWIASIASEEDPGGAHPDLATVLARHDNAVAHLAGHLHRWYELEVSEAVPIPHLILGSTRYDDDNFWLGEFESGTDEWRLLDRDKPRWMSTCADTWTYQGQPRLDPEAAETGDCSF